MSRYSIVTSAEGVRQEIHYSSLGDDEILRRIAGYESRYGMALPQYLKSFSCDSADPYELFDVMDWETLVAERESRTGSKPKIKGQ